MISEICTCDLDGTVTVVARLDGHFEAPNWHPDEYLIINGGGRIYRLPLDNPQPELIPTGDLANLNNDHGLSPDARTLAVSQTTGRGTSVIYLVPVTGGEPKRVTPLAPSWWHGWSPDGDWVVWLAYPAGTQGHPANLDVTLNLMPAAGGQGRVLVPLLGGQGTINVPSWAPDSRRFAFVRFEP
ncbi:MAG: hypothetical protein EBT13_02600 [Rhodobacteraceae bacterium]|nr:hypothetical protein [Paracoccaceae bacterium]